MISLARLYDAFNESHPALTQARLSILRQAYRGVGACCVLIGLILFGADAIQGHLDTLSWARTGIILVASVALMTVPVTNIWMTLPIGLIPGASSILAATNHGLMYAYVGIEFTAFSLAIWLGTWLGIAGLTGLFGVVIGLAMTVDILPSLK